MRGLRFDASALALAAVAAVAAWLQAVQALRGEIVVDVWEHAAVVRELAARPWRPTHPLLAVDAPHAFFSPYHLTLALASRGLGLTPLTALAAAGVANLAFVAFALRRLLARLSPVGTQAAPYALLFVFFLWGRKPWLWSGYLHLNALVYAAPYAATFAGGVMLLALSIALDAFARPAPAPFCALALLVALCILTHPTTAVALAVSLAAIFAGRASARWLRDASRIGAALGAGTLLALAWPYFPIFDLIATQAAEFNAASRMLYENVVRCTWPALALLPVAVARLRRDGRDPMVLMLLALAATYALGWLTGATGLGRVLAWIVVLVQMGAAVALVELAHRLGGRWRRLVPALALASLLPFVALQRPLLLRVWHTEPQPWRALARVLAPVGEHDVVLADRETSWMLPAFGGRVVPSGHPLYWVPDHEARRAALDGFFAPEASDATRRRILAQSGARWLIVDSLTLPPENRDRLLALGNTRAAEGRYTLVEIPRGADAAPAPYLKP